MIDPRLDAARDLGLDALLSALLPSGALHPECADRAARLLVARAFALAGETAAARRVLGAIGPIAPEDPLSLRAVVAVTAQRVGAYALAASAAEGVGEFHHAPTGGACNARRGQGPDGPELGTTLGATALLGGVDLAFGNRARAQEALRYVQELAAAQSHHDAFLLRRDAHGALITLWTATSSAPHALHTNGSGRGHGILGQALMFLAAMDAGEDAAAGVLLRFLDRCVATVRDPADALEMAAGAAWIARSTGDRTTLDAVARLVSRALSAQGTDGRFGVGDDYDSTARCVAAMSEVRAALDVATPRKRVDFAPSGYRILLCNVPEGRAQELSDRLVEERLAACVNVIPIVLSTYEWKNAVERERESTLVIKTTADRVAAATARIRELHPYELPEVISIPLGRDEGNRAYLEWIRAQVTPR